MISHKKNKKLHAVLLDMELCNENFHQDARYTTQEERLLPEIH